MVLLIVVTHWGASAVCGIIHFSLRAINKVGDSMLFMFILNIFLDIMILISFITTYLYFYITVRRLRRRGTGQHHESGLDLLIKKFKLPCYIVVTYLCFNLTSTIMFTASRYVGDAKRIKALLTFAHVPAAIGIISDSIIYVFANRNVSKLVCSAFITRTLLIRRFDTTEKSRLSY